MESLPELTQANSGTDWLAETGGCWCEMGASEIQESHVLTDQLASQAPTYPVSVFHLGGGIFKILNPDLSQKFKYLNF